MRDNMTSMTPERTRADPKPPRSTTPKEDPADGGRTRLRRDLIEGEILEQAAELFARRGFTGTSLRDVAEAMGVSRSLLYYYVKNKDELLAKMVAEITETIASAVATEAARHELPASDRLKGVARALVTHVASRPLHFRVLDRSEDDLPSPLAEAQRAAKRAVLQAVETVVTAGIADGEFRPVDPHVAALGVIGLCNWTAWWFRPGPDHPVGPVADQLAEMAVSALLRHGDLRQRLGDPADTLAALREGIDHLERLLPN